MKKKILSLVLVMQMLVSMACVTYAEETVVTQEIPTAEDGINATSEVIVEDVATEIDTISDAVIENTVADENIIQQPPTTEVTVPVEVQPVITKLTSNKLIVYVDVIKPAGNIVPANMTMNVFSENDVWLHNNTVYVDKAGEYVFEFYVPEYEPGAKFKIYLTEGMEFIKYGSVQCKKHQYFTLTTQEITDAAGVKSVANSARITASPFHTGMWKYKAEKFVNDRGIKSETSYLIWVSKANFMVSVFLPKNGKWECIKYFPCSIGTPSTPTVTGQFKYLQYINKWYYADFYVGPVMRFYNGYAIHSTLIKYDGTPYDSRTGKMLSHGCVRVSPENMNWLVYYVPKNSKIYVTNE